MLFSVGPSSRELLEACTVDVTPADIRSATEHYLQFIYPKTSHRLLETTNGSKALPCNVGVVPPHYRANRSLSPLLWDKLCFLGGNVEPLTERLSVFFFLCHFA